MFLGFVEHLFNMFTMLRKCVVFKKFFMKIISSPMEEFWCKSPERSISSNMAKFELGVAILGGGAHLSFSL